jgi:hypothetical protein
MVNNGKISGSYTICAVMIYAARKKLIWLGKKWVK